MSVREWGPSEAVSLGDIRSAIGSVGSISLRDTMQNMVYPRKGNEAHSLGYFQGKTFNNFTIAQNVNGDIVGDSFSFYTNVGFTYLGTIDNSFGNTTIKSSEASLWFDTSVITEVIVIYDGIYNFLGWYDGPGAFDNEITPDPDALFAFDIYPQVWAAVTV
jgi:hypothetical protein